MLGRLFICCLMFSMNVAAQENKLALKAARGPGRYEVITSIAQAHQKSAYQVILRWHLQCGTIAIPGSTNAAHIAEDYDIFDFELTPDEMQRINGLDQNYRFASY